jgi:hypothetical protein
VSGIVRFLPLCISVAFTLVIAVLVLTPLAWILMGRPDETYPELFFLGFGAPPALILLGASAVIALLGGQRAGGPMQPGLRPLWVCIAVTVVLVALLFAPLFPAVGNLIPRSVRQAIIDLSFFAAWPSLVLWMIAASIWAWTRPRSFRK